MAWLAAASARGAAAPVAATAFLVSGRRAGGGSLAAPALPSTALAARPAFQPGIRRHPAGGPALDAGGEGEARRVARRLGAALAGSAVAGAAAARAAAASGVARRGQPAAFNVWRSLGLSEDERSAVSRFDKDGDGVLSLEEAQIAGASAYRLVVDTFLRLSPVLILMLSVFAFEAFPWVADFVQQMSFQNFDIKSGRPVADQVLVAVVVPGLGILFATLASQTLSVLRSRQQEMRRCLRQEATLVDTLRKPLRKLFRESPEDSLRAMCLMEQYAICVVAETEVLEYDDIMRIFNIQSRISSSILDLIGKVDNDLISGGDANRSIVFGRVVGYAQGLVNQLDQLRAQRRASTSFTFPLLHWAILVFLAMSLPTAALLLTSTFKNTSQVVYEDELVRLLVGIITAAPLFLLSLLADLNEPFAGYVRLSLEPLDWIGLTSSLRKEIEEQ